jgi:hypothetical protein
MDIHKKPGFNGNRVFSLITCTWLYQGGCQGNAHDNDGYHAH